MASQPRRFRGFTAFPWQLNFTSRPTENVERQNLTIRMQMRRMTRLTNAFSRKWENLWAAYCRWFAYYNSCRIHRSPHVTPAMEAGIADHVWELAELLA